MSILSQKIKVFPSTRRASANSLYRESRLVSEGAVVETNNRVLDKTSFVVTNPNGAIQSDVPFEFVIYGYHFTVNSLNDILSSIEPSLLVEGAKIYASIELDTEGGVTELVGQDTDNLGVSEYTGINFTTEIPTVPVSGDTIKYLHIFTKENGAYVVPFDSLDKYDIGRMAGSIDCGEIL